jgi:hypothetical protein
MRTTRTVTIALALFAATFAALIGLKMSCFKMSRLSISIPETPP